MKKKRAGALKRRGSSIRRPSHHSLNAFHNILAADETQGSPPLFFFSLPLNASAPFFILFLQWCLFLHTARSSVSLVLRLDTLIASPSGWE